MIQYGYHLKAFKKGHIMKKIIFLLILALCIQSFTFAAEEKIPSAFWKLIEEEAALTSSDDLLAQIENWKAIINLFDDWAPTNQQKLEIVTPRLQKIIHNYETLKLYDEALEYVNLYLDNAIILNEKGLWNEDAINWAQSKMINLNLTVDLFVTSQAKPPTRNLAMHEPSHGLIYGATYDKDPRIDALTEVGQVAAFPKDNSAFLIYLEFGQDIKSFDWYISQVKEAGGGLLLAWNAYEVYSDMAVHQAYIKETAQYLNALDIPVFLRYAGEFNVAEEFEDANGFKDNFRYLTNEVRKVSDNVAMVWSPNDISASDRTYGAYYPGDAYVDWVGVSTYTTYYFGNKTDHGALQESIDNQYFTGPMANPLSKIEPIIEAYGHKKPIMITENGVGHYSKIANEDLTDWAIQQLRRAYAYIPLKYPKVKGIFYFNTHIESNLRNNFALYENDKFHEAYIDLTNSDVYLEDMNESLSHYPYKVDQTSQVITGDRLDLQTLVIVPGVLEPTIRYRLNGQGVFRTTKLPYHWSLKTSDLKAGFNELVLEVLDDQQEVIKIESYTLYKDQDSLYISKPKQLIFQLDNQDVEAYGQNATLDAAPFLKDGRSMVPLRYIGEALGATVTWFAESQSVHYQKGDLLMELTLNNPQAIMNGEPITLDVAPTLVNGRTFVPIRVISEFFGAKVTWRGADRSIIIDLF